MMRLGHNDYILASGGNADQDKGGGINADGHVRLSPHLGGGTTGSGRRRRDIPRPQRNVVIVQRSAKQVAVQRREAIINRQVTACG